MKPWDRMKLQNQNPNNTTTHNFFDQNNPILENTPLLAPAAENQINSAIPPIPPPIDQNSSYSPYNQQFNQQYNQSYGMSQSYNQPYASGMSRPYGVSPYSAYGSTPYSSSAYSSYSPYSGAYGQMTPYNNAPTQLGQQTQQAFFVIEQLIQTVSGFSQMLDSTFHATQSSFMAMMGLAEQFHHLKRFLSTTFSIQNMLSPILTLVSLFKKQPQTTGTGGTSKSSKYPIIIFILITFLLPWLMTKLLNFLKTKQVSNGLENLEFGQALYDYNAQSPDQLSFHKGDIVAILSKCVDRWNPNKETLWWNGRLQQGVEGLFPANYVRVIKLDSHSINGSHHSSTSPIKSVTPSTI